MVKCSSSLHSSCFTTILLLVGIFLRSRDTVQWRESLWGRGGVEESLCWEETDFLTLLFPFCLQVASLTLSLSVFHQNWKAGCLMEAWWSAERWGVCLLSASQLDLLCTFPLILLLKLLSSTTASAGKILPQPLLTPPHPLTLHSKCCGNLNEIQATIPYQMAADTLILKYQCLCSKISKI